MPKPSEPPVDAKGPGHREDQEDFSWFFGGLLVLGFVLLVASALVAIFLFPGSEGIDIQIGAAVALSIVGLVGATIILAILFIALRPLPAAPRAKATDKIALGDLGRAGRAVVLVTAGLGMIVLSAVLAISDFPREGGTFEQSIFSAALGVLAMIGAITVLVAIWPRPTASRTAGTGARASLWSAFTVIASGALLGLLIAATQIVPDDPELKVGMIVILAVSSVMVLLFVMASGYSTLGLADKNQALGLPEGTVRALIALFLIVVFVIMGIYLFSQVQTGGPEGVFTGKTLEEVQVLGAVQSIDLEPTPSVTATPDPAGVVPTFAPTYKGITHADVSSETKQLALQLVTLLGTLATAVASFYFASSTVASATKQGQAAASASDGGDGADKKSPLQLAAERMRSLIQSAVPGLDSTLAQQTDEWTIKVPQQVGVIDPLVKQLTDLAQSVMNNVVITFETTDTDGWVIHVKLPEPKAPARPADQPPAANEETTNPPATPQA